MSLADLLERAANGGRLSYDEGVRLYTEASLHEMGSQSRFAMSGVGQKRHHSRFAGNRAGMQWKQSALLAKDDKDGAQQVRSHVQRNGVGIGVDDNLPALGNQVTCDSCNTQKVLRGGRETIGIDFGGIPQLARYFA